MVHEGPNRYELAVLWSDHTWDDGYYIKAADDEEAVKRMLEDLAKQPRLVSSVTVLGVTLAGDFED